jgi:hypothetical protein
MNFRTDDNGNAIKEGAQVEIAAVTSAMLYVPDFRGAMC